MTSGTDLKLFFKANDGNFLRVLDALYKIISSVTSFIGSKLNFG